MHARDIRCHFAQYYRAKLYEFQDMEITVQLFYFIIISLFMRNPVPYVCIPCTSNDIASHYLG